MTPDMPLLKDKAGPATSGVLWRVLAVAAMAVPVLACGCGGSGEAATYFRRVDEAVMAIRDGNGLQRPEYSDQTYFELLMSWLSHRHPVARIHAAEAMQDDLLAYSDYYVPLDAYIDHGPVKELEESLLAAWRRAEVETTERWVMGATFLAFKTRVYLWKHPDVAKAKGVPKRKVLQDVWARTDPETFADELIAERDADFISVWDDYQYHIRLVRAGKLKN